MNPVEILKAVREFLELDSRTIAAIITGIILGFVPTYLYFKRRGPKGLLRIIESLRHENKELETELLKASSEVGRLREDNRKVLEQAGKPPQPPPLPPLEEVLPQKKQIMYEGKSISRDDVVAAMRAIDAEGGPKWDKKNKWAVHHDNRAYPPKQVMGKAINAARRSDFSANDAIWFLQQLGFDKIDRNVL